MDSAGCYFSFSLQTLVNRNSNGTGSDIDGPAGLLVLLSCLTSHEYGHLKAQYVHLFIMFGCSVVLGKGVADLSHEGFDG